MIHRPYLGLAIVLAPLLTAGAVVGCGGDEEGPTEPVIRAVRYVQVADGSGPLARSFSGAVRAGNQSRLSFQVNGRIQELLVKVGDQVTNGQRIAALDPTDFELQLSEARASAAQARAQAVSASANYERTRGLYESNNASRSDLDNARAGRDSAQSASAAAGQAVRRLQRQLEYATLSAPGEGRISDVTVEASEVVAAGQVVAVLQVGEQLEVAVDVPESAVNRIEQGGSATIRVSALGERDLGGTIYEVGTPTQGATVFPVTVRLSEVDEELRAGMAATVTFELSDVEEEAVLRVPPTAVGEDREGRFVYLIETTDDERGILHRTPVEVGGIESAGIEIRSGISPGDLVVTAGVARVSDGLEVRVPPLEGAEPEPDAEASEDDGASEEEGADEEPSDESEAP